MTRGLVSRLPPAALALAATLLISLFFLIAPGVDLAVSGLFYREGEGFPLAEAPALQVLRRSSAWAMTAALPGALVVIGWQAFKGRLATSPAVRRAGWLLLGLALGPGLLVNGVLKALWGRPRPVQVEPFGGDAPYVPVWWISDWCDTNCSFVSGEAASAVWIVAAVVLLPSALRRRVLAPVLIYGVALSLNRVAFGGHFLSDVLLSWTLTALVLDLLWRLVVAPPAARRSPKPAEPASQAGGVE